MYNVTAFVEDCLKSIHYLIKTTTNNHIAIADESMYLYKIMIIGEGLTIRFQCSLFFNLSLLLIAFLYNITIAQHTSWTCVM